MCVAETLEHMRPRLTAYAGKIVGYDDAEDMVQDITIKLMRIEKDRAEVGNIEPLREGYVWITLRTTCFALLRMRKCRIEGVGDVYDLADILADPDQYVQPESVLDWMVLDDLTDGQQVVMRLYMLGCSKEDISKMLHVHHSAIVKILQRAGRNLRLEKKSCKYQKAVVA